MIQFLIAILLGLACPGKTTQSNDTVIKKTNCTSTSASRPVGGENGQIPPPPFGGN